MDKILIVEDDRFFREMFSDILAAEGYAVDSAACGAEAFKMLGASHYGLVVTDLVMPDISGMELLSSIRETDPTMDVIMVTGNANLESAIFALKHGARDYLIKPVNPDEFRHSVAQCMSQRRLLDENEELKNMLNLFQSSQAIAGCLELERVYHLIVDAVVREMGLSRGCGLFPSHDELAVREIKGITPPQATALLELLQPLLKSADCAERTVVRIDLETLQSPLPELLQGDITQLYLVFICKKHRVAGVLIGCNEPGTPLPDISGRKKNILFLVEQALRAFDNAESYNTARDMLFIDDLSGLFNYRYLEVALERELKRVERYASHLAILFLDIDSFKQVNDTHGHLIGSSVIREMGTLLKKSCREVDVVIRYGGDEYTIILVETTCQTAAIVAERIRSQVAEHTFLKAEGYNIRLTCSIGYSCCPDDTASKIDLLSMADQAMYTGKSRGKNCVVRFTPTD